MSSFSGHSCGHNHLNLDMNCYMHLKHVVCINDVKSDHLVLFSLKIIRELQFNNIL